jgi:hypothetical protein
MYFPWIRKDDYVDLCLGKRRGGSNLKERKRKNIEVNERITEKQTITEIEEKREKSMLRRV